MTRRSLWLAVAMLLVVQMVALMLPATAARAQTRVSCPYLHEAKPESKYAFTQATVIGLSYARVALHETEALEAERRAMNNAPTMSNAQTLLTAMMRATKSVSGAYTCAEMVLEPYKKSLDQKMIGTTAEYLAAVYGQHRRLNDQFLDLLKNLPDASQQPTKLADVISTIEVEREKLWIDLRKASTLTLLGLLDSSRLDKDGKLRTLLITRAERTELLERLLRAFPEVKKRSEVDKPGTHELIFIASLYQQFLTNPYKCADE